MSRENQTAVGVRDAWDFWLNQHPVSVPEIIQNGVREAVKEWLDVYGEAIIVEAVREWAQVPGEREAVP